MSTGPYRMIDDRIVSCVEYIAANVDKRFQREENYEGYVSPCVIVMAALSHQV